MTEPICELCKRPLDARCGGRGYIFVNEDTTRPCPNRWAEQANDFLGAELATVQHAPWTPLYHHPRDHKGQPIDRTTQNLVIRCPWAGLLPHLKRAFALKHAKSGRGWFFRITNDLRIKDVGVGAESYKARPRGMRDDLVTFNSITDLVEAPDLLIIRLGHLGYKNIAAAGYLKEALLIRGGLTKATWLILDPEHPWTHSHDPDVKHYIDQNFERISVKPYDPGEGYKAPSDPFNATPDEGGDVDLEEHPPTEPGELVPDDEEEEVEEFEEEEEEGEHILPSFELPGEGSDNKRRGSW